MSDHPQALDDAGRAAADALAHRLKVRDSADPEERVDPDVFALQYVLALRGQGWRQTAARPAAPWQHPGRPAPDPDVAHRGRAFLDRVIAGEEAP